MPNGEMTARRFTDDIRNDDLRFTLNRGLKGKKLLVIYEGRTDKPYYVHAINLFVGINSDFIKYAQANGKKGVKYAYEVIKKTNELKVISFTDNDLDDVELVYNARHMLDHDLSLLETVDTLFDNNTKEHGYGNELGKTNYQLPCHSIENLLVNEDSLKIIIQTYANKDNEKDFTTIIEDFQQKLNLFLGDITDLNVKFKALHDIENTRNIRSSLNFRYQKYNNIIHINKQDNTIFIDDIQHKLTFPIDTITKEDWDNAVASAEKYYQDKRIQLFHGKFMFTFLKLFLNLLVAAVPNKSGLKSIPNNLVELLSYAQIPESLRFFLHKVGTEINMT